jgi:hypothetical protein
MQKKVSYEVEHLKVELSALSEHCTELEWKLKEQDAIIRLIVRGASAIEEEPDKYQSAVEDDVPV